MDTPNLAAALAKVQANLPKLERDRTVEVTQKNGGTYSYSYVTLANLSDAILPVLAAHGLSFAAMPGTASDGKMCVQYHLMHESGETLTGEFPISGEGGIQMIGGRITNVRRYCLAAVVGLAAAEDDEARLADDGIRGTAQRAAQRPRQGSVTKPPHARSAQRTQARSDTAGPPLPGDGPADDGFANAEPVTKAQLAKMHAQFGDLGVEDREAGLALIGGIVGRDVDSSKRLTKQEATALIDELDRRLLAWQAEAKPTDEESAT